MDEGPFRMPRAASGQPKRRVAPEPAEPPRQPQSEPQQPPQTQPQQLQSQPQPMARQSPAASSRSNSTAAKKSKKWPFMVVIVLVALGLISVLATLLWPNNNGQYIDSSTYQAVFSTNGQVYFGKLEAGKSNELRLTDVYYVQPKASDSDEDSVESKSGNDLELIKLGSNEVYGPKNEMVFIKDQVLYYENLDPDGKVSNLIRDNN